MASLTSPASATVGQNEIVTDVDKDLNYSNRVLSQSEGIGVNFYTINFARYACADINLSSDGQRLYNHCLSNVPRWACADERLQFGFGDKHLLRNAGVQLYEYEHLLLASALGEFFSEDYSAAIFNALAEHYEDNDRPKPHLLAFKAFAHCANGLLANTPFPTMVDDRIRLNPYRDHDGGVPHAERTTEFVPIDKVALAIRMLSQCKLGKIAELTFIGGDIIGWFSAFVEMFLGMSQTLEDKAGNTLYWSNGQKNSISLVYVPPDSPPDTKDPTVIWLRKPINTAKRSDAIPPIFTGRVVGEAMFSKVFGTAFHRLDQTEAKAFGNALGGMARSFELWAADQDDAPGWMSSEMRLDPSSWGLGLIQTLCDWFPELRHLQGRMERAQKQDRDAAMKMCNDSIEHLEPRCGCYICCETKGPEDNPTNVPKYDFCIPTMMEAIIIIGLVLNHTTLIPDLFPSRAGILAMYKTQVKRRLMIKTPSGKENRAGILFGEETNPTMTRRLRNVVTLFSGSTPKTDLPDNLMAISHEGMCAYFLKLQRGDQAPPREDDNVIRVVMGPINWRQKTYSRLCLGPVQPPVNLGDGWEAFSCEHFKEKIYVK